MAEIPNPSRWLYNRPSEGIAQDWYAQHSEVSILDMAVILCSPFRAWDGQSNVPYQLNHITLTQNGIEVYPNGPELNQLWQDLSADLKKRGERNDSKSHLYSYSEAGDTLQMVTSLSDWSRMALGPMLRDGKVPAHYRDDILPREVPTVNGNAHVFDAALPNHLVLHLALLTADHHLILTTRSRTVAFEQGNISASVEQHVIPEHPLVDTIYSAVSTKLNGEAELKLTLRPETLRIGGIIIEPNVNNTGIIVVGRCEEDSSQVGPELIGSSRRSEFAPNTPVRTMPMDQPEIWVPYFFNPNATLHGTSRLRIVLAASYVNGYQPTLEALYQGYLQEA